ncbi:uncharacterized protein BO97DRAFT_277921 [Aspergillus homomorphus CBS 101889]|uniref:Uncharacterized protein n=1 Tax=Aspergillus homomorphus (strain CBS 101889) TaxID=1450537 RepID=A0A395HH95_ASPHC|nr:hypothetical protein BO97DRAFT_277921 [Aspergillus homomorphus CBS 101889]RAL06869.1 hypothetical protein BO97DRAFT_277921 [Aspergillus homomorphus CBS 101889]
MMSTSAQCRGGYFWLLCLESTLLHCIVSYCLSNQSNQPNRQMMMMLCIHSLRSPRRPCSGLSRLLCLKFGTYLGLSGPLYGVERGKRDKSKKHFFGIERNVSVRGTGPIY